jgi:hypothetical protein
MGDPGTTGVAGSVGWGTSMCRRYPFGARSIPDSRDVMAENVTIT